jgi:hypothetical protein
MLQLEFESVAQTAYDLAIPALLLRALPKPGVADLILHLLGFQDGLLWTQSIVTKSPDRTAVWNSSILPHGLIDCLRQNAWVTLLLLPLNPLVFSLKLKNRGDSPSREQGRTSLSPTPTPDRALSPPRTPSRGTVDAERSPVRSLIFSPNPRLPEWGAETEPQETCSVARTVVEDVVKEGVRQAFGHVGLSPEDVAQLAASTGLREVYDQCARRVERLSPGSSPKRSGRASNATVFSEEKGNSTASPPGAEASPTNDPTLSSTDVEALLQDGIFLETEDPALGWPGGIAVVHHFSHAVDFLHRLLDLAAKGLKGPNIATEDDKRAQAAQLELLHYIFLGATSTRSYCMVEIVAEAVMSNHQLFASDALRLLEAIANAAHNGALVGAKSVLADVVEQFLRNYASAVVLGPLNTGSNQVRGLRTLLQFVKLEPKVFVGLVSMDVWSCILDKMHHSSDMYFSNAVELMELLLEYASPETLEEVVPVLVDLLAACDNRTVTPYIKAGHAMQRAGEHTFLGELLNSLPLWCSVDALLQDVAAEQARVQIPIRTAAEARALRAEKNAELPKETSKSTQPKPPKVTDAPPPAPVPRSVASDGLAALAVAVTPHEPDAVGVELDLTSPPNGEMVSAEAFREELQAQPDVDLEAQPSVDDLEQALADVEELLVSSAISNVVSDALREH